MLTHLLSSVIAAIAVLVTGPAVSASAIGLTKSVFIIVGLIVCAVLALCADIMSSLVIVVVITRTVMGVIEI